MAEMIFRKAVAGRDDYAVESAGVAASKGAVCSRETREIVEGLGAWVEGFRSQRVSEKVLADATHVFAMTRGHLEVLEEDFPQFSDKYFLVCEFVEVAGRGYGADVPDPIGMGKRAYEDVARVLERAIPAMIEYMDQTVGRG